MSQLGVKGLEMKDVNDNSVHIQDVRTISSLEAGNSTECNRKPNQLNDRQVRWDIRIIESFMKRHSCLFRGLDKLPILVSSDTLVFCSSRTFYISTTFYVPVLQSSGCVNVVPLNQELQHLLVPQAQSHGTVMNAAVAGQRDIIVRIAPIAVIMPRRRK